MINNLNDLEKDPSQEIIVLLKTVDQKISNDGARYQKFKIRDTFGNEKSVFNWDEFRFYDGALPIVIKLRVEFSKDMLRLREFAVTDKDILPFLPKPNIDIKSSWHEIVQIIKELRPSLGKIVKHILMTNQKDFIKKPLSEDKGYARTSGLMEASLKMAKLAISISTIQPNLDKDLLVAASILYNIGSITTMNDTYSCSLDSILIGSNISSFLIIKDAYESLKNDKDIKEAEYKLLSHIITSKNPSFPEAVWVNNINKTMVLCDRMESLIEKTDAQASCSLGGTLLINNKLLLA